jgi:hypothetical protein
MHPPQPVSTSATPAHAAPRARKPPRRWVIRRLSTTCRRGLRGRPPRRGSSESRCKSPSRSRRRRRRLSALFCWALAPSEPRVSTYLLPHPAPVQDGRSFTPGGKFKVRNLLFPPKNSYQTLLNPIFVLACKACNGRLGSERSEGDVWEARPWAA